MAQEVVVAAAVNTGPKPPARLGAPPPTSLAPGFRFHPTDEELVRYYLRRKACAKPFRFQAVAEIDVYKSEPWELADYSSLKSRDLEWYFFSPVDRKYGNGSRLNRATGKGYWKATGKDRAVRHKIQTIGMKKTLVFHSGRAPEGKRTNWVMHEYRLCDSELERAGVVQDAFVLCRIFQKSGLGPPSGDRYAPFVEEEWDDDEALMVPGTDREDQAVATGDELRGHGPSLDQEEPSLTMAPPVVALAQPLPLLCKRERSEEDGQTKVAKQGGVRSSGSGSGHGHANNGSEDDSTTTCHEHTMTTTNFSFSLLEFPLLEPKENRASTTNHHHHPQLAFDSSNLEKSVPPGYLKFISNLENEILNVSMEREKLKIEVMRAQAMINGLQSRIDSLAKENHDLRHGCE